MVEIMTEEKPIISQQKRIKVGNLWMDEQTADIMAEFKKERSEHYERRLQQLEEAKKNSNKDNIDFETIVREGHSDLSEEDFKKRIIDKEMEYYLDTPDSVVDMQTYADWISSMLG